MNRGGDGTQVELTPLEDAIAKVIYDYQRGCGLDDESAGEDAFGIMRAVMPLVTDDRNEALGQAAKAEPAHSETFGYQQAGYADGWLDCRKAMRTAISNLKKRR